MATKKKTVIISEPDVVPSPPKTPQANDASSLHDSPDAQTAPQETKKFDLKSLANQFAAENDADIFVLNGAIDPGLDTIILQHLLGRKKRRSKLYLVICTEGGDADSAFRIARFIQEHYKSFFAVVVGWCKSAGTLICTGASDLYMGKLGQLGPLDVQLAKTNELGEISSGVTAQSSFQSLQAASFNYFETAMLNIVKKSGGRITTLTAADIATKLTVGLFSSVYAKMDPIKMGEDFRSTTVAADYARRLNIQGNNLKSNAVDILVVGYSSHGFIIDKREAASAIFERVYPVEGALLDILNMLGANIVYPRSTKREQDPLLSYLNEDAKDG